MRCTPSLSRRLAMRWHCSVTAVKNSRRFPTRRHCHCQRCHTAKLKVMLMRQYRSLATVIEEVAVQSCHRSLGAVKNLRRLPTCRHCHLQGGCAAKSKEISDAPTLQSRHRCWGGFCTVLSLQSHRRQEFEENERCGRSRQQPIQQRDFRHEQEEVTNKKLTERVRTEEVQMGRHDKQHIANTWE